MNLVSPLKLFPFFYWKSIHLPILLYVNKAIAQEKVQAKRELKDLISKKSSYTMLIRSMPAVRQLPADFFD